jgi:hypothetical protein
LPTLGRQEIEIAAGLSYRQDLGGGVGGRRRFGQVQ